MTIVFTAPLLIKGVIMFHRIAATMSVFAASTRDKLERRRPDGDREAGLATLEWVIIGSVIIVIAIAAAGILNSVYNTYVTKIPGGAVNP
jgi:hypothetical protein